MKTLLLALALIATSAMADIVIYPLSISTNLNGGGATCPGHYTALANYTKTVANGWGWKPDTNGNTVFTATDTNQINTHIVALGKRSDNYCDQTTVTVTNPPFSAAYRFTVYWTNNAPTTTNYPLVLHGFLP